MNCIYSRTFEPILDEYGSEDNLIPIDDISFELIMKEWDEICLAHEMN